MRLAIKCRLLLGSALSSVMRFYAPVMAPKGEEHVMRWRPKESSTSCNGAPKGEGHVMHWRGPANQILGGEVGGAEKGAKGRAAGEWQRGASVVMAGGDSEGRVRRRSRPPLYGGLCLLYASGAVALL